MKKKKFPEIIKILIFQLIISNSMYVVFIAALKIFFTEVSSNETKFLI